jgi:beta-lactam-binding protein with PASTA domain
VELPNLFGLTPGEAQVILEDLGLTLNVSNSTQPVADEGQDGTIVNQIPGAGINALPGDIVTVTLGEFVPPPTTTTTLPPTTTTLPPGSTTEA